MPNSRARHGQRLIALVAAILLGLPSPALAMTRNRSSTPQRTASSSSASSTQTNVVVNRLSKAPALAPVASVSRGSKDPRAAQVAAWLRQQMASRARASALGAPQSLAPVLSTTQREAFEELRERTGGDTRMSVRRRSRTPRQIRGEGLERGAGAAPGKTSSETTARAFLRKNRALLRLSDPDREMVVRAQSRDALGRTHVRFRQRYRGLEVWPAEIVVHLDRRGDVDVVGGAYAPTPADLELTPEVDAAAAIARARESVPGGGAADVTAPQLLIFTPADGAARLGWKLKVDVSLMSQWVVVIDAANASVLAAFNDVHTMNVAGSGTDLQGNLQSFGTWLENGTHHMVDTTKMMFDPTSNPPSPVTTRGAIIVQDALNQPPTSNVQSIPPLSDVTSLAATGPWLADAVSATSNFSAVYDYFLSVHGRNSLDNAGSNILAGVRIGLNFNNAFFISENNFMGFGDGEPFAGALDVVAHELTHGVTFHTSNLVYQNQSGALNEAFSDIFGEAVEAAVTGSPDWLVGTNLSSPFRNMEDPSSFIIGGLGVPYPEKLSEFIQTSQDNGGVHLNSSIINHAFYQLVEGLASPVSLADGERIFYRALTVHLTANSQFIDARLACILAAEELFGAGSAQALRVAEAFDFVEIFDASGTPDPPTLPPTAGDDSTLFVFTDPDPGGPGALCLFTGSGMCLGRLETPGDQPNGSVLASFDVGSARPAVTCDGELAVFVDPLANLCLIPTDGTEDETCLDFAGTVASVAVSPDGNRFGFVLLDALGQRDNSITVLDLAAPPPNDVLTFELVAPAPDGGSLATVLFADAMDFTADGRFLVYDAFNVIPLTSGGQIDAWSIYAIDLLTGATLTLVPPIAGLDIGFPALSQTSDSFVTFDVSDQLTGVSTIYATNLETGALSAIGTTSGFGAPSYNGDDTSIVFSLDDARTGIPTATGFSLVDQPVAADRVTPVGAASLHLQDADFGVIYRRGFCPEPGAGLLAIAALGTIGMLTRPKRRRPRRLSPCWGLRR